MYYVYIIQNKINLKIYVGQTNNLKRRWSRHKYEAYTKNNKKHLYQAIRKYRIENFQFIELESHSPETIDDAEIFWISYFNSNNKFIGYNNSLGGKPLKDPKVKKNRRPSMLGKKHTQETKQKMSEDRRGEKNAFFGKEHTQESKDKMSQNPNRKYLGDANYFHTHKFYGSAHGNSKLTEEIVLEIRNKFSNEKLNYEQLADIYNINASTASRIIRRILWNHI